MFCSVGVQRHTARQPNNFTSEYYFSRGGDDRVWRFQCHGQLDQTLFGVMSNSENGDNRVYGRLIFETPTDENTEIEDEHDKPISSSGTFHHPSILSFSISNGIGKDADFFDQYNGAFMLHFVCSK